MSEEKKWYSNGLSEKSANDLTKQYAMIENPRYGLNDKEILGLTFGLSYEDGTGTSWSLSDTKDIKELLNKTKTQDISKLEGKVIEAYSQGMMLRGLSVNENLIL